MSALEHIRRLAIQGRVRFTRHARDRMEQRDVSDSDVVSALISATIATRQSESGAYRVEGGTDMAGDGLIVIVAVEADLIVITMF